MFLSSKQAEKLRESMTPVVGGSMRGHYSLYRQRSGEISDFLGTFLLENLQATGCWQEAEPILLGSWSRGELCPRSDIDILFVGDEDAVEKVVAIAFEQGIALRYRVPEKADDWTVGVKPFDVLALLNSQPIFAASRQRWEQQVDKVWSKGDVFKKQLLKFMLEERRRRSERYDNISNYLEPNLKFGQGGLRDLEQALAVLQLFPEKFSLPHRASQVLNEQKSFFLLLRQKIHVIGTGDVINRHEQTELAKWFGYNNYQEFMRAVQVGLSEVSFYSDWVFEAVKSSASRRKQLDQVKLDSIPAILRALRENPSALMQERVRKALPKVMKATSAMAVGKTILRYFNPSESEAFFIAVRRSQALEVLFPEVKKLKGLVQHDQYHRYTADAHIIQAIKLLVRVKRKPQLLGALKRFAKELGEEDWKLLLMVCVYHDIAKGRKGAHEILGARLVQREFSRRKVSAAFTEEVAWLVRNHLLLSDAAFRKNPKAPSTWKMLSDQGMKRKRLLRLAIFTVIDIQATNPEAWNGWKERLLEEMVENLLSKRASRYVRLLKMAEKNEIELSPGFLRHLDSWIVEELPLKVLLDDYRQLKQQKGDLPVRFCRDSRGNLWVRFHSCEDRPGLIKEYVHKIYALGCQVEQSSAHTFSSYGVYDWFKVKTRRSLPAIKEMMKVVRASKVETKVVKFDRIVLVSDEGDEAVISFRGRDQKGALVSAVSGLSDLGLTVRWARVHTWGRQIDDVFGVKRPENLEKIMNELCARWQASPSS